MRDPSEVKGIWMVAGAALFWSFGGVLSRLLGIDDPWNVVAWRSLWAAAFLFGFMLWRDGARGTAAMLLGMRLPAFCVALCFATASISFIVALGHTTVANILLMQAGVPLIAALMAYVFFGERINAQTAIAIGLVILGVSVMVSQSLTGKVSPIGDLLALLISVVFALATVITRRYAHIRMVPAVFVGVLLACLVGASQAGSLAVNLRETAILVAFGALNLGAGLALFVTGARLVPAALAALISTAEPVLGPIWVWLFHGETPSAPTLIGGAIVMGALLWHVIREFSARQGGRPVPPAA
jgi:drug/metabolite transporter (DMT)-like permease